jgi:hypothetical protein
MNEADTKFGVATHMYVATMAGSVAGVFASVDLADAACREYIAATGTGKFNIERCRIGGIEPATFCGGWRVDADGAPYRIGRDGKRESGHGIGD